MAQADSQLIEKRNALANQARALTDAQQQETLLEQEATVLASRLSQVNGKLKPLDSLLEQKERLQKLAADSGADIAEVSAQLETKEAELARQKQARDTLSARIAGDQSDHLGAAGQERDAGAGSGARHAPCAARRQHRRTRCCPISSK